MGLDMTINRLPAPTWHWLHVNEASLSGISARCEGRVEAETPQTIYFYKEENAQENLDARHPGDASMESSFAELAQIPTGLGEDMDRLAAQSEAGFRLWEIAPGVKESRPVRLHFTYEKGEAAQNRIGICAGEDSEITVVMDFRGEAPEEDAAAADSNPSDLKEETAADPCARTLPGDRNAFAAVQTKICAKRGAKVRLVQIQKLSDDFTFLNDVGASCAEDAVIESIQIVLGGGDTYMGMRTDLGAKAGRLESKIGYLLDQKETLDMNYLAYHTGAKTTSHMDVSGVLRGEAKKLFRGTIDFRNGSVGAKGDEKEDVLLFSDGVINRTIPLILCEEEDVEGNHGATIGRLDEELLFYLSSRGIEEEEIYEMMARARIDALCRDIPDPKTQELVQTYLG